jgi:small redox-active disulfide protein 2
MLTIKVIGPGCPRCKDLEKMCFNVCAENDIDADIQKITDINKIASMGVLATPALFINDKLYIKGKLPTKSTLVHWIKENLTEHVQAESK